MEEGPDKSDNKQRIIETRKSRLGKWFKDPYNRGLLFILIVALAIRLFYFFMTKDQPLWWDEAEYMLKAKKIAFNSIGYDYWSPRKPILLSFVFGMLYKIGLNEQAFKFIIMICSFLIVYFTYLVAKDFFDRNVGLIVAFFTSIWWVPLFYSARIETLIPSTMFLLIGTHFFYRGYVKKEKPLFIWLFGVFFALMFLARVVVGILVVPVLVYILMEERWKAILNKDLWIALILALVVVSPFFIWLFYQYPSDTIGKFIGLEYGRFTVREYGPMGFKGLPMYFVDIPNLLKTPLFILFLFSCVIFLSDLFLGFDLIFKKEYQNLRLKVMMVIWIVFPLIMWGLTTGYAEQRHAMLYSVFMFSIIAIGVLQIYRWTSKYNKILAAFLVVAILSIGTYPQLIYGYELAKSKVTSYLPVEQAALWIKQNSNPNDIVYTMSSVQNLYYSERDTWSFSGMTQEDFEGNISAKRARYFILSVFEPFWLNPVFDPNKWVQANSNFIIPVNAWFEDAEQKQPVLIVYELNWSNFKGFANISQTS